jgi:hypothetical protein
VVGQEQYASCNFKSVNGQVPNTCFDNIRPYFQQNLLQTVYQRRRAGYRPGNPKIFIGARSPGGPGRGPGKKGQREEKKGEERGRKERGRKERRRTKAEERRRRKKKEEEGKKETKERKGPLQRL